MQELIARAAIKPAKIVFPEGNDKRIQEAAIEVKRLKIAEPIIFHKQDQRLQSLGIEVIDPSHDEVINKYVDTYIQIRKNKSLGVDASKKLLISNPVFIAALMVRVGLADALIAGAENTTKDVAKAVIHCIGPNEGKTIVSSCFIMDTKNEKFGHQGKFMFADSGIIVSPSSEQLAEIAIDSGDLFRKIFDAEPYVALLSYATHGSASGESIDKIRSALEIVKSKRSDLKIDGELQGDAAIVKEVADIKCSDSEVAGRANVLIFPDLNSGNICYKLVDRLVDAEALGPIFLGTRKPASDLSRGCAVSEIVLVSAVLSIMAQLQNMDA
ncbi:MAG: phosphate acetyltransferase [Candidatus Saelkia tenebricola]|nr:phosphate acetyltransferase [Candidatus Saelkia tenebricola]